MFAGASIVVTELNCHKPHFWEIINEKKVTSFSGVPYMYEMIKKLNVFKNVKLPSLQTLTQAGGKLNVDLQSEIAQFAKKSRKKFVVMYGASEATARMGWLPPEKSIEMIGSMGIPIPGGRFELINERKAETHTVKDS